MDIIAKLITFLENNLFLKNGTCPICGKVLFMTDHFLCSGCDEDLPVINGPTCESCGRLVFATDRPRCKACAKGNFPFAGGYAWLFYHQSGKALVHAIKFKNRPNLGIWAGTQIGRELAKIHWSKELELIIPVPLHPSRLEDRGYNQSEKIARGILAGLEESFALSQTKLPELKPQHLRRSRNTPHQVGQGREERLTNLLGAFSAEQLESLQGKKVLVVDDVLTTGATLAEVAATLLEAGAKQVYIATVCAVAE
ncbi:ComF family protein [Acetobacterium sp.]|uniref:ComF family protein n=1 Tax=Acetobacterium sp. TaxID=1872094 RepID=UPI002F3F4A32